MTLAARPSIVCVLIAAAAGAGAQPLAAPAHRTPRQRIAAIEAAVAEVEAGRRTTPLIGTPAADGRLRVTFLARRADGRSPRVVSDITGWGEHIDGTFNSTVGRMTRIGQTEWYALEATAVDRARVEYLLAYGITDYRLDPNNPRQSSGPALGGARASEFVTPGYVPPPEFTGPPPSPSGLLREEVIESRTLGGARRAVVYTPPGFDVTGECAVAVFLDLRAPQVSRVLDWLAAHGAIEPVVVVFVELQPWGQDRPSEAQLRTFLGDEVPAWLAARHGVEGRAERRAVIGISFGAKDALDVAVATGRFGRLGLLVPGRRIRTADIAAAGAPRVNRLRVAVLAGRYDQANLPTARAIRQAIARAGDDLHYAEVPEGHSAVTWTYHLRFVLTALFGTPRPE